MELPDGATSADQDDHEVYLWGSVTEEAARVIIQDVRALENEEGPLVVHVNSDGGEVDAAFAIYDALRACPRPIHTMGWGVVASAALLVYLAGDARLVHRHTRMMAHDVWGNLLDSQGADDLLRAEAQFRWMDSRIDAIWQQVVGGVHPSETTWWNGGRECVRAGIATAVVPARRRRCQDLDT